MNDLTEVLIAQPESWICRRLNPDWRWIDPTVQALARIVDSVEFTAWANTKDGQKNRNRPKPFPRPNVGKQDKSSGFNAVDIATLNKMLGV